MRRILPLVRIAALPIGLLPLVPAHAETLTGKAGYLSEWSVSASVKANAAHEFSGPLTWTHTGLCTIDGPVEKAGEIHYRISGLFTSRMDATLTVDGALCSFIAALSGAYTGVMDCPGTKGVPMSISVK